MSDSDSPLMLEILKGMRADNSALRADMTSGFAELRAENAQMRADMNRGFADVRGEIKQTNERLGSLEGRVDRMSEAMVRGFTGVHERIDRTNERIDATNERLDATNERLDATNERLDATNERLEDLCEEQRRSNTRLDGLRDLAGEKWRVLDQRVGTIETRLDRIDPR